MTGPMIVTTVPNRSSVFSAPARSDAGAVATPPRGLLLGSFMTTPWRVRDTAAIGPTLPFLRIRAAHQLRDLLRDLRLARAVVGARERSDQLLRVVSRVLHGRPPRAVLRRRALDHRAVDAVAKK